MTVTFKQQGNGKKSWKIDGQLTYDSPTNKLHNDMLRAILDERGYLDLGEVACWTNDPDFKTEAKAIIDWWIATCKLVAEYVSLHPNEEDCITFINTLPTF